MPMCGSREAYAITNLLYEGWAYLPLLNQHNYGMASTCVCHSAIIMQGFLKPTKPCSHFPKDNTITVKLSVVL